MVRIAGLIDRVLSKPDDETVDQVRHEVEELASAFPLYGQRQKAAAPRGA
jgi:glycine/serine hydroxymethyltransferase